MSQDSLTREAGYIARASLAVGINMLYNGVTLQANLTEPFKTDFSDLTRSRMGLNFVFAPVTIAAGLTLTAVSGIGLGVSYLTALGSDMFFPNHSNSSYRSERAYPTRRRRQPLAIIVENDQESVIKPSVSGELPGLGGLEKALRTQQSVISPQSRQSMRDDPEAVISMSDSPNTSTSSSSFRVLV